MSKGKHRDEGPPAQADAPPVVETEVLDPPVVDAAQADAPPVVKRDPPHPDRLPKGYKRPPVDKFTALGYRSSQYDEVLTEYEWTLVEKAEAPLAPKPEAPAPTENRASKGRVLCEAITTVAVDSMPVAPGVKCWVPEQQAKRLASKGALKIV